MYSWKMLFATKSIAEASIVQGKLEENDVPVQILNKLDSSYLSFGEIEVYVPEQFLIIAKGLLENQLSEQ
jgi:hypothetical protein